MIQISPYTPLQVLIDAEASSAEPPESFSELFLQASTVMAAYGDRNQSVNATLCAFALRSMPEQDRHNFMSTYEVPATVWQMVNAKEDPVWPKSPPVADSPPEDGEVAGAENT